MSDTFDSTNFDYASVLRNHAGKMADESRPALSAIMFDAAKVLDDQAAELTQLRAENAALKEQLVELGNKYAECGTADDDTLLAVKAEVDNARLRRIETAARGLVEYRKHNCLNWQLEKADTWIDQMRNELEDE